MGRSARCCREVPPGVVLITSRRRLTALADAAVMSLDTLPADDATE
jgi:hypothetical protein